jgi:peptidylprolyl isomerase
MGTKTRRCVIIVATLLALAAAPASAGDWRALDPDNTLVIDTTKSRIVVEMRPDLAPLAVARVKLLAREHVYDGLLFHRVIEHFVDQTGNPGNHDGGTSSHPNLPPEFTARANPDALALARRAGDGVEGLDGATPVGGEALAARRPDGTIRVWGAYCPGVAGMGREADPGSANSEIFFMRDAARRLDRDYTVWGRVVSGLEVVRAMAVGEPPAAPDRMTRVAVMADLPPADRPHLEVLDERGPAMKALIDQARAARGADFSVCDVEIPTRPAP